MDSSTSTETCKSSSGKTEKKVWMLSLHSILIWTSRKMLVVSLSIEAGSHGTLRIIDMTVRLKRQSYKAFCTEVMPKLSIANPTNRCTITSRVLIQKNWQFLLNWATELKPLLLCLRPSISTLMLEPHCQMFHLLKNLENSSFQLRGMKLMRNSGTVSLTSELLQTLPCGCTSEY